MLEHRRSRPPVWTDVPMTGGLRDDPPDQDADHAIEVFHELDGRMSRPLELRLEPEHYRLPRQGPCRAADVAPFPDYDSDPPPPEVYCQLPDADPSP